MQERTAEELLLIFHHWLIHANPENSLEVIQLKNKA